MARAVWKGPFVEESLIKKAMKECTNKNKDGCYVHYSSMLAIGQ